MSLYSQNQNCWKNITDLIDKGFDEKTLTELKRICSEEFDHHPTLFFVLHRIFNQILNTFDDQGMPVDFYKKIETIVPNLKEAIEHKNLQNLDNLCKSFNKIFSMDD